jgi:hypothetical protein
LPFLLSFLINPQLLFPLDEYTNTPEFPIAFGQSLPKTPKLQHGSSLDLSPLCASRLGDSQNVQYVLALLSILGHLLSYLLLNNLNNASLSTVTFDLPIFNRLFLTIKGD